MMSHSKSNLSKRSKNSNSTHAGSGNLLMETPPLVRRRKMTEVFQSVMLDRSELVFPNSHQNSHNHNSNFETNEFRMDEESLPHPKTSFFNTNFDEFQYK